MDQKNTLEVQKVLSLQKAAKYSIYEYMNDNYEKFVDAYNKDKKYLIDRM